MLDKFITVVAYTWVYFQGYIITAYILSKLLTGVYLFITGYEKWYLGFLPFTHAYYKHDLASVSYLWTIPQIICTLLFITTYQLLFFIPMLVLHIITDYKFAIIYADQYNAGLYSVVPLGKFFIMIKEVLYYARIESR